MGCYIHIWAEVKKDGKWAKVGKVFKNTYYDQDEPNRVDEDGYEWNAEMTDSPYQGRSYNLFSILANVRNGEGFAGCDTGDGFVPIAMPRGLPEDVNPEIFKRFVLLIDDAKEDEGVEGYCSQEQADRYVAAKYSKLVKDADGRPAVTRPDWHSASWLTVAEMRAYDWQQKTKHRGWVDPWNFELWRRNGKPGSWSGGVFGGSIEHISNQQMAKMIDSDDLQWVDPEPEDGGHPFRGRKYSTGVQRDMGGGAEVNHYTLVEWEETYAASVKHFLDETLPALEALDNPAEVRIVFWFDN